MFAILMEHVGHHIEIISHTSIPNVVEIVCKDCDKVLLSFNRLETYDKIKELILETAENFYESGGKVEIDNRLPSISISMLDGTNYYFQEHEAIRLLNEVPENIKVEDYIAYSSQGW